MNEKLQALYEECQYPNWDGYNAFPVQRITLCHAQTFISLLPAHLLPTSCGADPDGAINLEWYKSLDRFYRSVSTLITPFAGLP